MEKYSYGIISIIIYDIAIRIRLISANFTTLCSKQSFYKTSFKSYSWNHPSYFKLNTSWLQFILSIMEWPNHDRLRYWNVADTKGPLQYRLASSSYHITLFFFVSTRSQQLDFITMFAFGLWPFGKVPSWSGIKTKRLLPAKRAFIRNCLDKRSKGMIGFEFMGTFLTQNRLDRQKV